MKTNQPDQPGFSVPRVSLGTMTFGVQTDESDAHAQLDCALAAGVTLFDTAEIYPVNPMRAETYGRTEEIIGNWIAKNPEKRNRITLATKHAGPLSYVRGGRDISKETIEMAIDNSLKRLKTDYIDLYQFHWPNRGSYHFRRHWEYDPGGIVTRHEVSEHILECLQVLQSQVEKGKIRYFGLSNETAWGMSQWLGLAEKHRLPRAVAIQNEYSLLCRLYDTDLLELGIQEDVALLAYSPLAGGLLTGKYLNGVIPPASRMSIVPDLGGRLTSPSVQAVEAYLRVAHEHGHDPVHLALAWLWSRPFKCSAIIGATTLMQLEHALSGMDLVLDAACLRDIEKVRRAFPLPF